jgi:hypothetical protein
MQGMNNSTRPLALAGRRRETAAFEHIRVTLAEPT